MRCPKCGAFMEEGKDICFMCGTNAKTYSPSNNNGGNMSYNSNSSNSAFGSGSGFGSSNAFGSGADYGSNNGYNQMKEQYNNSKKNYRNVELKPVKNGEKDIFDFFSEHKKIVSLAVVVGIFLLLGLIGNAYYKNKTKDVELEPVFNNLYYEVDDSLKAVNSSSGSVIYTKSGDKGTACSITISYGASTSGDYVSELFSSVKTELEPELNSSGNVVNSSDIYYSQENSFTLNDTTWHYLNIYYKEDEEKSPTQLKYKYLTSIYNGYHYDITLMNNSNDESCSASLDNFARTLKFLDTKSES